MDRNQAKEFYPILQAYAEGRGIECRTKPSALEDENVPNEWAEIKVIEFYGNKEYRINPNLKPESEYRPFKDAIECWTESINVYRDCFYPYSHSRHILSYLERRAYL